LRSTVIAGSMQVMFFQPTPAAGCQSLTQPNPHAGVTTGLDN